jgi:hypothetical protein
MPQLMDKWKGEGTDKGLMYKLHFIYKLMDKWGEGTDKKLMNKWMDKYFIYKLMDKWGKEQIKY